MEELFLFIWLLSDYENLFFALILFASCQKGNVANQREHLILLLANTHIRLSNKQAYVSKVLNL